MKIVSLPINWARRGNAPETAMFGIQLAETQMELAEGVRDQAGGNISGTSIQGIGPRPTEKKATKRIENIGAKAGSMEKDAASARRLKALPATLTRATGLRPARSSNQIATRVMTKLTKARKTGVEGDLPIIIEE